MEIRTVTDDDKDYVMSIDKHVNDTGYRNRVYTKSGYVLWEGSQRIGIMAYCVLWDNLPFLNFLYVNDSTFPPENLVQLLDNSSKILQLIGALTLK